MVKKQLRDFKSSGGLKCKLLIGIIFTSVLLISGCSSFQKKVTVPPVTQTPTQERHIGKIVWYDLFTHDLAVSARFYKAVLGWTFSETEPGVSKVNTVSMNGVPIGNAFQIDPLKPGINESRWITYISVEDVDKAAVLAAENLGRVYLQPKFLPDRGRIAAIIDPQGAIFGILDASGGDPPDFGTVENQWIGSELWTRDIDKAVNFYQVLAGYERRQAVIGQRSPYNLLYAEGEPRAGIVKIPWKEVEPDWIPYAAVADAADAAEKAEKAGGKVLVKPHPEVREGLLAIIADPAGAVFAVQQLGAVSAKDRKE